MKSNKIYRKPHVITTKPYEVGAAFTMRLLNFLYVLGFQAQKRIQPHHVAYFSARHTRETN